MLFDKLKAYADGDIYPFHMPGHKRNTTLLGKALPYDIDITEINDFDNLYNADGVIDEIQQLACNIYKCAESYLLVNGATCGIIAAVRAMTSFGDKVIVARNSHKSVYNAIELCGLKPVYIYPQTDSKFGVASSITPTQVSEIISKNQDAKLIILTSPTYEGVVSDIKAISEIAHKNNILLLVDEAHGAHFALSDKFPQNAINCVADVSVVSLHKTLPSLTQTALLLTSDNKFKEKLKDNLSVFETSSPSYVLMSSIENALNFCIQNISLFNDYIQRLNDFSDFCKRLNNIEVMCFGNDNLRNHSFFDFDISKIVVSLKNVNINGADFAELMRSEYNIEVEMAYSDYVIFMTSVCDSDKGFSLLKNALNDADKKLQVCYKEVYQNKTYISLNSSFIPFEKYKYNGEFVKFCDADKKISLEYVWAYPPGIPLIVPGEVISSEIISQITELSNSGVNIHSTQNKMPYQIYAVKFD